jgi:hemerythrin-like domain-containing protein
MLTQIGAEHESDFSEPLGMLSDCHKRIQFFLKDLVRLAENAQDPLDDMRRTALERALRYFRESGPRHTADEEESLFPRLRAMKDARLNQALEKIELLEADHERANVAHGAVDEIGIRWLGERVLSKGDATRLRSLMRELKELYAHHLDVEDKELFPVAASLLSEEVQVEVGREMAARRGISAEVVKAALR